MARKVAKLLFVRLTPLLLLQRKKNLEVPTFGTSILSNK